MDKRAAHRALLLVSAQCAAHARACTKCVMPIMDTEGNPGYIGEACADGAELLVEYRRLEKIFFK